MPLVLALKVDVDTDRGTRLGVPILLGLLRELNLPACFLFSLGPDNTGKAIRRIFRPGFFKKVSRSSVVSMYGVRTLLNGTLFPAPHIGQRNEAILRLARDLGFEVGIHAYDHFRWQDYVRTMSLQQVENEFGEARKEFERIFGEPARTAGAAGWQCSAHSREAYDAAGLLYASDSRGTHPFYPKIGDKIFRTLEIPSTLPTFDELLGRPEFPDDKIVDHYVSLLREDAPNIFTIHAEIEGMAKLPLFRQLLQTFLGRGVEFVRMDDLAKKLLSRVGDIPTENLAMGTIDGRSGLVAVQAS